VLFRSLVAGAGWADAGDDDDVAWVLMLLDGGLGLRQGSWRRQRNDGCAQKKVSGGTHQRTPYVIL